MNAGAIVAALAPMPRGTPANDRPREGFVLGMWTGLFPLDEEGRPVLFPTARRALAELKKYPAWGRTAVTVYRCTVRPNGQGGRPDYILGRAVAYGQAEERARR